MTGDRRWQRMAAQFIYGSCAGRLMHVRDHDPAVGRDAGACAGVARISASPLGQREAAISSAVSLTAVLSDAWTDPEAKLKASPSDVLEPVVRPATQRDLVRQHGYH